MPKMISNNQITEYFWRSEPAPTASKTSTWRVRFGYRAIDGTEHDSARTFKTRKEAELFCEHITDQIARRKNKTRPAIDNNAEINTVADLLRAYPAQARLEFSQGKRGWDEHTSDANVALINNYIIPVLGEKELWSVTSEVIDDALNKIFEMPAVRGNHKKSEKKVSSRTVFDCRKVLSRAFGWAAKTPSITAVKSNPVADAAWSAPKSKKRKVLAGKEMLAVLDIARENNYLMYVFLIVLAQLSSRTGEAVALQWSDLDHDNKGNPILHVNKSLAFRSAKWMDQTRDEGIIMRLGNPPSTKNNPTREWVLKRTKTGAEEGTLMDYVYITPEIEALLVQYKAWQGEMIRQNSTYKDMNFIFAQTTGFPITSEVYTKQFRQLLKEANIANPEQYDVYSLRHFSVSKKLDLNGNDFASVRSDTKHKETQTLVTYYDIPEDKKRIQTAAGMSDFLFNRPATENDSDESVPYKEDSRIAQLVERFKQNPDQLESLLTLFGISNGNDKSD